MHILLFFLITHNVYFFVLQKLRSFLHLEDVTYSRIVIILYIIYRSNMFLERQKLFVTSVSITYLFLFTYMRYGVIIHTMYL